MKGTFHYEYGLHSNIPECCIEFYINEWPNIYGTGKAFQHLLGWGYVPCFKCLDKNNRIKLRNCEKECGKNCAEYFRDLCSIGVFVDELGIIKEN